MSHMPHSNMKKWPFDSPPPSPPGRGTLTARRRRDVAFSAASRRNCTPGGFQSLLGSLRMTFSGECFWKSFSRHQPSPPHAGDMSMWRASPRNPTASFQSSKSAE